MLTKEEWISQEKERLRQALEDGYTQEEINRAYDIAREMGVSYLSKFSLEEARSRLAKEN